MKEWGAELTRLCRMGEYRVAYRLLTGGAEWYAPSREWWAPTSLSRSYGVIRDKPPLQGLTEAVCLAERVDNFLATVEREGTTRQLARDCRDNLDLLTVLADWCEDASLPWTASEARHLHRLVRAYRSFS